MSTLSSTNFTDGNILLTERNHTITITYSRSARDLDLWAWEPFSNSQSHVEHLYQASLKSLQTHHITTVSALNSRCRTLISVC